jgi:hypothetical protein
MAYFYQGVCLALCIWYTIVPFIDLVYQFLREEVDVPVQSIILEEKAPLTGNNNNNYFSPRNAMTNGSMLIMTKPLRTTAERAAEKVNNRNYKTTTSTTTMQTEVKQSRPH